MERNEIIVGALMHFMRLGIKSLTMDDISRHLGISKKTLYQHVSDKKELVREGMKYMIAHEKEMLCDALDNSETAIDELIGVTKCVSSEIGEMHPSVIFDMQKYHPDAWKLMIDHKNGFIQNMMLENIKRGMKEGLYRDNLNPEVITYIYMGMVEGMLNADNPLTKKMSLDELHTEVIRYHIKGIANDKGLAYLKEALKKNMNEKFNMD